MGRVVIGLIMALAAAELAPVPQPGRLVDVGGGRRLHWHCTGAGAPTVLLEAGASAFAIDWSLVQPELARHHRVCSYDRAGSGWSEPRVDVETPQRIVEDLHRLLRASGEGPPYLMVGASMGGIYVRLFQLSAPTDVMGLVLVDPATEDRLFTTFGGQTVAIGSLTPEQLETTLPKGDVPIPTRSPQTGPPFDRLPPDLYATRVELDRRLIASFPPRVGPDIVRESAEGRRVGLAQLLSDRSNQGSPFRRVPVIVLTRGQSMTPGIAENHQALAALSTNSAHLIVPEAGHEIHLFDPQLVVRAVREVANAARETRTVRLSPRGGD